MKNKAKLFISLFSLSLFFTACSNPTDNNGSNAVQIAEEAFTYGLPLVLVDLTRRQMLHAWANTPPPVGQKGMNEFFHLPRFPDHTITTTVRPNVDTFYSNAFLDLSGGPIELSLPNTGSRYHMMQLMDAYTNVFGAPGTRTTGNTGGTFVIAGPGWTGTADYRSSTNYVWVLGRTLVYNQADTQTAYALMQQYRLTRLTPDSAFAEESGPDISMTDDVNKVVAEMPIDVFFNYLNHLMVINPPTAADRRNGIVQRMARIGVAPGAVFNLADFSSAEQALMLDIPRKLIVSLASEQQYLQSVNGWNSTMAEGMGNYGTNYKFRASIAVPLLAANLPDDAVYFSRELDETGAPLNGSQKYILRFATSQTPPVNENAFWSLTLYEGNYLSENTIGRYAVGDRSNLVENADGSIEIYIQHTNPGVDKENNWLPAPAGNFNLTLRAYIPKPQLLDGSWKIPQIITIE